MKKNTTWGLLVLLLFCGIVYATDKTQIDEGSARAKAQMEKLLYEVEINSKNPDRLNDALYEYMRYPEKPHLKSEERREVSKRFIKVFYSIDDSLTNMANKERIMEIVGFSDNGPEAHEFFLRILSSDNEEYRKMALWGIRPLGVHGDDLYEKIKELEREGKITKIRSLQCLARANPTRALEEMKIILKTTKSVKEFVLVGANLPARIGEAPEVLDIIVDRFNDFEGKPVSAEDAGYSPERAVSSKTLWKYIDGKDGVRLKEALEIIRVKGVCGDDDLPVLEQKLRSADKVTRETVSDFLGNQVESRNLRRDRVIPILKIAENMESDQKVKRKIQATVKRLTKQGGR